MKFISRMLIVFAVGIMSAQAAELMYVNSKKAKLYQQASFSAPVISGLSKGNEVEVLTTEGKWMRVKYAALNGWVPRYSLSKSKPSEESVSFFNRIKSFFTSDNKRARVSNVSTAGGVRGLSDGEMETSGNRDYESVEKMEQMTVSEQEVETFIEGNQN
ncbi:MAG: SH3 domain-containing protein [Gammaproteobacteria bacterium]|nr:SH3 domain-containing protein [Gammaproteobacteria bacterium]